MAATTPTARSWIPDATPGGYAAVVYAFTGPSAVAYRTITLRVYGMTSSGPQARIGLWNRTRGSMYNLLAYDAWAVAGPVSGADTTVADGEDHPSGRTIAADVRVRNERIAGGSAFHVQKVQVTIVYGSWAP